MRRFLTGGVVMLVVVLLALPAAMGLVARPAPAPLPPKVAAGSVPGPELKIRVYFPDTKQVQELPLDEYLVGVVAAEMPPEFHDEALKAQFVVARTYAVRRMRQFQGKGGCPLSPDADVCADPKTSQAYVTKEAYAKAHGASAAEQLWQRLAQLGQQTAEQVLRYHGEFIDPLYHAISGTVTEDSGSYFPQSLPYLKSVNDHWASIAPPEVMNATERRTPETLAEALSRVGKQVAVPALAGAVKSGQDPVVIVDRTPTGRVKTVKVLGVTLSGRDFRDALGLKSTNFTVSLDKGSLVIRTTGNGHGVGMSQWGANGMAQAGKTYKEILTYYYTGVDVSQIYDE